MPQEHIETQLQLHTKRRYHYIFPQQAPNPNPPKPNTTQPPWTTATAVTKIPAHCLGKSKRTWVLPKARLKRGTTATKIHSEIQTQRQNCSK